MTGVQWMTDNTSRHNGIQLIDRAIAILNCFSLDEEELSIAQIAEKTRLPKPTVYRILSALRSHDWIEQDDRSGLYRLGYRIYLMGNIVGSQMDLRRSALPLMKKLAAASKETVNLNIIEDDERICVELVEGSQGIRNFVRLGTRNKLLYGASGQVLLAHLPSQQAEKIISDSDIELEIDRQALRRNLETIRAQGYAVTYGSRVSGACGISAPVFGRLGQLIAGLTVSGPQPRMREAETQIVEELCKAAANLSERMGYVSSQDSTNY